MCKFTRLLLILALQIASIFTAAAYAQPAIQIHDTEKGKVRVEQMITGLDTPWAMAMLPGGKLIITEKDGRMLLVDPKVPDQKLEIDGLPRIRTVGQGGLLDVVLDPGFAENNAIYFTFADRNLFGGVGTAIASAKLESGDRPALSDFKVLFSMENKNGSRFHFGSRIVPDGKGNLYFTIGDRGTPGRAQDPFDAAGSVLRIRTDGSVPQDNPFADGKRGMPQIWSIGHRNPQGATLNETSGDVWTLAHGAKGGDEINIPEAGNNYGWPEISYGTHYSGKKIGIGNAAPGFEQPIYYWDPSIAPSGMDFYKGELTPQWNGDLFVGALKFQTVVRLEVEGDTIVHEERLFGDAYGRIRDVRSFSDGALWFLTDDSDGAVYRVTAVE